MLLTWDLSTLCVVSLLYRLINSHGFTVCHMVVLPFSWSHGMFFISQGFINFEWIFSQTHSFIKKQTQAAHSNAAEERISSMISKKKKNKQSQFSIFELDIIVHFVSEDTY